MDCIAFLVIYFQTVLCRPILVRSDIVFSPANEDNNDTFLDITKMKDIVVEIPMHVDL